MARSVQSRPGGIPTCSSVFVAAAAVASISFAPFLRGALLGHSFYFRDVARAFFPWRRFVVDGLLHGELRYWNPYTHEGELLPLPPISYPLDLLQVLLPNEAGFSLLLAAHVPLAGVAFLLFARGIGASLLPAAAGGLAYALGGFCLSSLNLYVYSHAIAWAPLAVLALVRAADRGRRDISVAAMAVGVMVSTTAAELVLQCLLIATVMIGRPYRWERWCRTLVSIALGFALAAPTLAALAAAAAGSERATGFSSAVVLAHSVHPLTLGQVLVANWYGDLADITTRFWGHNFFPRGFPYFLSLYLGPSVLALAFVGSGRGERYRIRLLCLAGCGLVLCLGRWVGLEPLVEAAPMLRRVRYPSKAFFTVHFVAATLVALGVQAISSRGAWKRLSISALGLGSVLVLASVSPLILPGAFRWFVSGFFPPREPWTVRIRDAGLLLSDARLGGALAVLLGMVALGVRRRLLSPALATTIAVAIVSGDLLRAGAGVNPMVSPAFFQRSPEVATLAERLREERVFTCDPTLTDAYVTARSARIAREQPHEAWTFALLRDTLTPYFNMVPPVRSAYGIDLTMLVPVDRALSPEDASCRDISSLVPRLRSAAVSHVLSIVPLLADGLELEAVLRPEPIAPLAVHVYRVEDALSLQWVGGGEIASSREAPGMIEVVTRSDRPTSLVVREAYAPGWSVRVGGRDAALVPAEGRYLGLRVPAGESRVEFRYRPPRLRSSLALAAGALAVVIALPLYRPRRQRRPDG
jgi:hypothetical protein